MSAYISHPDMPPMRIQPLKHHRLHVDPPKTEAKRPEAAFDGAGESPAEPTYADFIGGPIDSRVALRGTRLDDVS